MIHALCIILSFYHILILGFRVALVPNTYLKMREILFDSSIAYEQQMVILPIVEKEPGSDVKAAGLSDPISTIHKDSSIRDNAVQQGVETAKMDTTTLALDL